MDRGFVTHRSSRLCSWPWGFSRWRFSVARTFSKAASMRGVLPFVASPAILWSNDELRLVC
eukprot:2507436-Lingulodinium_polyedra.AAC.1